MNFRGPVLAQSFWLDAYQRRVAFHHFYCSRNLPQLVQQPDQRLQQVLLLYLTQSVASQGLVESVMPVRDHLKHTGMRFTSQSDDHESSGGQN